jgi:hypothetical protein
VRQISKEDSDNPENEEIEDKKLEEPGEDGLKLQKDQKVLYFLIKLTLNILHHQIWVLNKKHSSAPLLE